MSTQLNCLNAVADAITALGLTDVEEIQVRAAPQDDQDYYYPGITVHPIQEREFLGTNSRDDHGYGCQVTMAVNDDNDVTEDDLVGAWRDSIRKEFIHQKLPAVSNCTTCLVENGPIYSDRKNNMTISTLVVRVIVRETRG